MTCTLIAPTKNLTGKFFLHIYQNHDQFAKFTINELMIFPVKQLKSHTAPLQRVFTPNVTVCTELKMRSHVVTHSALLLVIAALVSAFGGEMFESRNLFIFRLYSGDMN